VYCMIECYLRCICRVTVINNKAWKKWRLSASADKHWQV